MSPPLRDGWGLWRESRVLFCSLQGRMGGPRAGLAGLDSPHHTWPAPPPPSQPLTWFSWKLCETELGTVRGGEVWPFGALGRESSTHGAHHGPTPAGTEGREVAVSAADAGTPLLWACLAGAAPWGCISCTFLLRTLAGGEVGAEGWGVGWAGAGPTSAGGASGSQPGEVGCPLGPAAPREGPELPIQIPESQALHRFGPHPRRPTLGSEACSVSPAASPQLHSTAGGGQNAPSQDGSMTFPCPMGQGWGSLAAGTRRRAWACQPPRCSTVPEAKVGVPAVTTQREGRGQGRPAWRGGAPTRSSWGLGDSGGGRGQPPKSPSSPLAAECVGPGLHRIAGRTCT